MKISDMTDDALGKMFRARHTALCAAHDAGFLDVHPVDQFNSDQKALRDHRAATDGLPGNVASSKEIEDLGMDDPIAFPGKPANPQRRGASVAAMDALIPGYSRVGNRHYEHTVDEDRIVQPVGGRAK